MYKACIHQRVQKNPWKLLQQKTLSKRLADLNAFSLKCKILQWTAVDKEDPENVCISTQADWLHLISSGPAVWCLCENLVPGRRVLCEQSPVYLQASSAHLTFPSRSLHFIPGHRPSQLQLKLGPTLNHVHNLAQRCSVHSHRPSGFRQGCPVALKLARPGCMRM